MQKCILSPIINSPGFVYRQDGTNELSVLNVNNIMPGSGIEPETRGFSVLCSTN